MDASLRARLIASKDVLEALLHGIKERPNALYAVAAFLPGGEEKRDVIAALNVALALLEENLVE
jgi:hypothetical protein